MPTHGEERNRRIETRLGPDVEFKTPDGQVAYRGPMMGETSSVSERWCDKCQAWVTCRTIVSYFGCPVCSALWPR